MTTTPGIRKRSPTQLTDHAVWLREWDENRCNHRGMIVGDEGQKITLFERPAPVPVWGRGGAT